MDDEPEACGRCAMSTVVDATDDDARDPFADGAIEVADEEARAVSRHVVALGRLRRRLDALVTRLTYGR